ncbi:DNA-binding protein [Sulfurimonas sp.]|uniref:DNA-binding protein n=1 Tax=Sulfurimonas sp. TaxID=2022749 RepID=UPI0025F2D671|nr:DNA-binding protein [Sulfurimonas sp.]
MLIEFENLSKIGTILIKLEELEAKLSGEKRWLNIKEASNYLGYSQDHIHKLKNSYFIEGKHYYKKTGKLLFDKIALDNWVQSSTNSIDVKEVANNILKDLI